MKHPTQKKRRKKRVGIPPGSLIVLPEGSYGAARQSLFEYDKIECTERLLTGVIDYASIKEPSRISWLDVDGIQDSRTLERIGSAFDIHPLVLEDIQNTDKRPKIESYDDYLFMIFKMLRLSPGGAEVLSEQVGHTVEFDA